MDPFRRYAEAIQVDIFRRPSIPKLTPADVELIIFVLTTLMSTLSACWGGATGPIVERLAYRWVTSRPWFSWRSDTIRDAAFREWVSAGGGKIIGQYVSDSVESMTRKISWDDFHEAWVKQFGG